ncbi:IclR family transcriptional regulator [Rhodococcus sp. 14-2470-1b]|uniref:IclR family transcriptional regulator n=1 Tax=Rhodococcus sp. 14-2470-1b TaxID=2023149 RepID=UPI001595F018|nr:helix-turn-helix domain-containing protein [Rhodococcus sp. 14-2470-1b]
MAEDKRRPHHRAVDRIAALLGAATTEPRGLTLTELAHSIDAPLSSVQKLVYGLVASGFLDEREGRYTIGPLSAVLERRSGRTAIADFSRTRLEDLHERTGAAALLVVRIGDDAVNIESVGLTDAAAFVDTTRWRHPLPSTAGGRVLLAYMPTRPRRAWAAENLRDDPERTTALLDELDAIRADGVAVGPSGSLRPDLESVAVPLVRDGEVVAAVALTRSRIGAGTPLDEVKKTLLASVTGPER